MEYPFAENPNKPRKVTLNRVNSQKKSKKISFSPSFS